MIIPLSERNTVSFFSSMHLKVAAYRWILAAILLSNLSPSLVLAKSKPDPLQGLVEETPRFDMSSSKYSFQLGIKHSEVLRGKRKPILHAQDSLGLLHGGARTFQLQAAERGAHLQSQTAQFGHPLQGQVDMNGKPLTGRVVENPRSPLNTKEIFHPPFQLDVRKLTSDVAPDLVSEMESEIEQARTKTADIVAQREKQLEPKMRADAPRPDIPPVPGKTNLSLGLSHAMDSEIVASKQNQQDAGRRTEQLKSSAATGGLPRGKMPMMPGDKVYMPAARTMPGGKTISKTALNKSEREMSAEFARANKEVPPTTDIDGKLNDAARKERTQVATAQPGLDAILTHTRSLPGPTLPAVAKTAAAGDAQDVVPWDQWHAQFAQLAHDPLLASFGKTKNPSGADTVEITVWRDHRVEVKLSKPSNQAFDSAVVSAYKQLSGNSALEFPKGSRRSSITFLVDNEHRSVGVPSTVQSQTSTGDKEIIRYHF